MQFTLGQAGVCFIFHGKWDILGRKAWANSGIYRIKSSGTVTAPPCGIA
jgi:hypothetical protein